MKSIASCSLLLLLITHATSDELKPYVDNGFRQEVARHFTHDHGLPPGRIDAIHLTESNSVVVQGSGAWYWLNTDRWEPIDQPAVSDRLQGSPENLPPHSHQDQSSSGRDVIAGKEGIFERLPHNETFQRLEIADGQGRLWGVRDIRAVTYDEADQLWVGTLAGLALRDREDNWTFFEGKDGLPYNRFTCAAAGPEGVVWFGTEKGAIRYQDGHWHYRQGRRWLINDQVNDLAIDPFGTAWLATDAGVTRIGFQSMSLHEKAAHYEAEIEAVIKRTPFGYLAPVGLARPGDRSEVRHSDSDNDGLWTSMYGAGECFAYAATGFELAKQRAKAAFEALRFLQVVTQGTEHSPPNGYVARTIRSTELPDPNIGRIERDRQSRETGDRLWKVYEPRWPKSADGKWFWKSDTSSDELDGHYFFYGLYYDLVAETEQEKARVAKVVRDLTDHLIQNDYNLTDHDGTPTRWGIFGPNDLNHNENWHVERGLNSLSLLSYLTVAEYVTREQRFTDHIKTLMEKHAYHTNAMVPKTQRGIGSGNQSDDEMAFMGFYNLLRYSSDENLKKRLLKAFYPYWTLEQPELNPFFNFTYAAWAEGEFVQDPWGEHDVSPWQGWLEDSVSTLQAFPLDRADWGHQNSHRLDLVRLPTQQAIDTYDFDSRLRGTRVNGKALPVDERYFNHWNTDPFQLDYGGSGHGLGCGTVYLLPYYMGLYHGYITLAE